MPDDRGFATVDDVIKMLINLNMNGYGDYIVCCNNEYIFARVDEKPRIDHGSREVSFGGYA